MLLSENQFRKFLGWTESTLLLGFIWYITSNQGHMITWMLHFILFIQNCFVGKNHTRLLLLIYLVRFLCIYMILNIHIKQNREALTYDAWIPFRRCRVCHVHQHVSYMCTCSFGFGYISKWFFLGSETPWTQRFLKECFMLFLILILLIMTYI